MEGNQGISIEYVAISTEQCVRMCKQYAAAALLKCKLGCSARAKLFLLGKSMLYFYNVLVCTVYVYRSNVLALYSFYPPEPNCITQSKTQRSQINFAKEPNLAPEPRCGQPCFKAYFGHILHFRSYFVHIFN